MEEVERLIKFYEEICQAYNILGSYLEKENEIIRSGNLESLSEILPERAKYFLQISSIKEEITKLLQELSNIPLECKVKNRINEIIEKAQDAFERALKENLMNITLLEERKKRLRAQFYVIPYETNIIKIYEKTYIGERW